MIQPGFFKSTAIMNWFMFLTFVMITVFVIDNYRNKDLFGLLK